MNERFGQRRLPGFEEDESPVSTSGADSAGSKAAGSNTVAPAPPGVPADVELRGQSIYVLDAHALIFQVFHALPEMTSPRGEAVGAVYGFVRDLMFLRQQRQPDFLFAAFDMPGPTFRHQMYQQYKEDRAEMPDELVPQIPKIWQVLEAFRVPVLGVPGYEADDILATVARIADQAQADCFLVTNDKDCRQLISDHVRVYNIRKDQVLDRAALREDWGVGPQQVVDFQSLVGDKIDNVPGVPLIGPKIAADLLQTYGTLDAVLDHADEVKGTKRRQNLIDYREQALLSRELVRLTREVPVQIDWNAGRVGEIDASAAAKLFADFGFRRFGEQVSGLAEEEETADWESHYRTVTSLEELRELVAQIGNCRQLAVDTETTHLNEDNFVWPRWAQLVGLSLAWGEGEACYIPFRAPEGDPQLPLDEALELLRPLLEDAGVEKIGHNLKFELIVLRNAGIELAGLAFDTMVASYLLDAGARNHKLDEVSKRFLKHAPMPISELIGSGRNQKRMDTVAIEQIGYYAAEDADIPWRLRRPLTERLEEFELTDLFVDVEMPLITVLGDIESIGISIDVARLRSLSQEYGKRLESLEAEIHELAGHQFNIASPKQLAAVLFEELKLPVVRKNKSGPSTDADVLAQLALQHALPAKIVEYRQYAKLKNTYVDALPEMVHPETGRIHCALNQVVAATGRLSSSDPNLQNIPVRSERGREIREAFLPERGWRLLAADYSQIELRVLAHFSGDEALGAAFAADQDIHSRVACEIFEVAAEQVDSEMRRVAKAVNFGILYGQSPRGLARSLGIEVEKAEQFIQSYFDRYPGVGNFLAKTLESCRKNGYVKTILGRRREIRGVRGGTDRQLNLPERTAVNTVIQGSAADLIKLAMLGIHRRLRRERFAARMLLQIHDELIFEVPSQELDVVGELVVGEMSTAIPLSVPLKVDLKVGDNWADCEPWPAAE